VVTSAGVVRLGLGFVASLVIARALGPSQFGVYAVLAASVGIVGAIAEGGLTEAAVLRISAVWPNGEEAGRRARAFFWLRLCLAIAVVVIGAAVVPRLINVEPVLVWWALLGIVATAASGAVSAMLQATGAFGRMSSLTLLNTGLTAVLALALALASRLDLLSALVVLGIGTSIATFAAGAMQLPRNWIATPKALMHEARQLSRTGRWLWVASLFAMLTANLEVLLLNAFVALPLVGAYALALNVASKADVVNHSLYTVLLPGVSNLRQVRQYLQKSLVRSALVVFGLAIAIALAEPLVRLIYGEAYAEAAVYLRWLLGIAAFDVVLTPILLLPLAYREARLLAAGDAARAIALTGVAVVAIPAIGPFGAIVARLAARLAGAAVVLTTLWLHRATLQIQHEEPTSIAHERPLAESQVQSL
jgi:O-antigen/teichoic acid export membrane protein